MEENTVTKYLKGYTPLQAEFFIWKYIQLEIAAESVYGQLVSFEDLGNTTKKTKNQEFRQKTINEKLKYLQDMFKNIEKYNVLEERSEN